MLKKISTIPFKDTPEQAAKLDAIIAECAGDNSMLMHVMQEAQAIYGYLPFEVQNKIAEGMNVPLEKVYGVATFYAQFALSPKGKYDISVCLGTACYVKGAQELLDEGIMPAADHFREPAVAASRWRRTVYNCSRSFLPERLTSRVERRPRYRPDRKITEGRAGNCRLNQGGTT